MTFDTITCPGVKRSALCCVAKGQRDFNCLGLRPPELQEHPYAGFASKNRGACLLLRRRLTHERGPGNNFDKFTFIYAGSGADTGLALAWPGLAWPGRPGLV